jgi:D-aminoacyl-tRNA deacylase
MIIDILNSDSDPAGRNIRAAIDDLLKNPPKEGFPLFEGNEVTFHTVSGRIIHAEKTAVNPDADLIIVVSRHSSVNPVPVLTVHPAGNFGTAGLGGNDWELGLTAPSWMKSILQNHAAFVLEGYRVSYEITHHGPTDFPVPFFFVEVGSTEKEWNDSAACMAAAKSVLYARPSPEIVPLIGFGGTHYAVRQTAIGLETKGAFGHMMHTRDVGGVSKGMVSQMIAKSGGVFAAHIDRKALSKQEITHIEGILAEIGLEEITEGDLHKMNAMSLSTWVAYRDLAAMTAPDLKIFPHGRILNEEPAVIELPSDLFSAAFLGYEEIFLAELDKMGNIFHTTGKGGRLMPTLFTSAKNRQKVSGDLIVLSVQQITRTQDSLVEGDQITITRRQFDPKLARTLGVPSGPLYGQLVAGKSVTLPDGSTITPDMVTKVTRTSIKIPGLENYS